jgi:hypothetical protein
MTSACSGGISGDDAKSFVNDFLSTVADGDYAKAESFLHPDRPADLQNFFESIEKEKNVDFSIIKFERYTGFESSVYNSAVDGSMYSIEMDISVSDRAADLEVELVRNDNGYGIYEIDIDFD